MQREKEIERVEYTRRKRDAAVTGGRRREMEIALRRRS